MMEVAMAKRKRGSSKALRAPLRSPGRPGVAKREDRRQFWRAIAAGRTSGDAGRDAGVAPAVGSRWFREAGGMPPSHLASWARPRSVRYLAFTEREEIALLRAQGHGVREIARRVGRSPSTISRELRREQEPSTPSIEQAFSKLKAHLRRIRARTFTEVFDAIGAICDLYDPQECRNYFTAAGYVSG